MNTLAAPAEPARHAPGQALLQFLSFSLEGRPYAVPLAQVAEITPLHELRKIPHMPRAVDGLLDLRGMVFPVLNLRTRLHLPATPTPGQANIIILELAGARLGILVDKVLSVITVGSGAQVAPHPLLAGPEGALSAGFLLQGDQVVVILDSLALVSADPTHPQVIGSLSGVEQQLDADLRSLLEMAPSRTDPDNEPARVLPQIETAIQHTEQEVEKVITRIEDMLGASDRGLQGLVLLKQQALLGRMKEAEGPLADLERLGQRLQSEIFEALHRLQFQDVARQKLERVLLHIQGLQQAIGHRFRDAGKALG